MRRLAFVASLLICVSFAPALAADVPGPLQWGAPATAETAFYPAERWQLRGGVFGQCCFFENGASLGTEVVAPRVFVIPGLPEFFTPRVHAGLQVSLNDHTSYGYAGLLWSFAITRRFFLEPFVGLAITDGKAHGDATHNAIGCTALIHSGANLGYRIDRNWSVMLTLDHISNGNLCSRNVGVNNYGVKVGYAF